MNRELKEQAILLRKKGYSYSYIQEKIPIPKSTLSDWLSGLSYKPNKEVILRIGRARAASGEAKSKVKRESLIKAQAQAKLDIGSLTKRDLFMLGVGLYLGEGTKSHSIIRVINADPKIIQLAIKWFKDVCNIPPENFRIRIHLYPDNDITECLKYWSKVSKIPLRQFQKTQIDRRENKKISKRGKLPNGTAHLSIRSGGNKELGVFLFRRIQGWISEVTNAGVV